MNDDCLLEIFSVRSLTPMDLCSLAETCTRFKRILQRVFPKKFTLEADVYNDHNDHEFNVDANRGKSAPDVERILKNFGSSLSTFTIDKRYDKPLDVLDLLTVYCVAGTLDRLKIHSVHLHIPEVLAVKLTPIFERLMLLNIGYATVRGGRDLFAKCDSLVELRVSEVDNCNEILVNHFPQLERFSFGWGGTTVCGSVVPDFITRHQRLKTLNLGTHIPQHCKLPFLCAIRDNCKELEELNVSIASVSKDDFGELQHLDQLRLLRISLHGAYGSNHTECIPSLQALKSLETLIITHAHDDSALIPALSQLKTLRELYLQRFYGPISFIQLGMLTQLTKLYLSAVGPVRNLVDVIGQLTNLEELTIYHHRFVLDEKTFSKIVQVVKGRPNVLQLKCKFDFVYDVKKCDENVNVRLIDATR